MDENERKKKPNWGSLISTVIFIALVAGQPLLNMVNGLLNGANINVPWTVFLPYIIGAGIFVVGLFAVVRALGGATSGPRLPSSPPIQRYDSTQTPGFEPVVPPMIIAVGVVGLVVLGALALVILL